MIEIHIFEDGDLVVRVVIEQSKRAEPRTVYAAFLQALKQSHAALEAEKKV